MRHSWGNKIKKTTSKKVAFGSTSYQGKKINILNIFYAKIACCFCFVGMLPENGPFLAMCPVSRCPEQSIEQDVEIQWWKSALLEAEIHSGEVGACPSKSGSRALTDEAMIVLIFFSEKGLYFFGHGAF